jgi:hypothetical protein
MLIVDFPRILEKYFTVHIKFEHHKIKWLFVKWAANLLLWAAKLFFWAAKLLFWQQKWAAEIIFLGSKNSYFEQQIF